MKAPKHLQKPTAEWWESVMKDYQLEPHHVRLLTLAAESWDRGQQAREAIEAHGLTYEDRYKQIRARPEVAIERDSRTAFCRVLRELALDIEEPGENRPPIIPGNAGLKVRAN